jgi:hypothetical protein
VVGIRDTGSVFQLQNRLSKYGMNCLLIVKISDERNLLVLRFVCNATDPDSLNPDPDLDFEVNSDLDLAF